MWYSIQIHWHDCSFFYLTSHHCRPDQLELEERAGKNPYGKSVSYMTVVYVVTLHECLVYDKSLLPQVTLDHQHRMMSVASTHIAELPKKMLIPSTIIRLMDSIGEGIIYADI